MATLVKPRQNPNLEISFQVTAVSYQNTGETLSSLTLKNPGNTELRSSGWTIYFNFSNPRVLDSTTAPVTITHINGDFFKLSPKPGFRTLKTGETFKIDILTRTIKNFTDYPKGFYLVLDNDTTAYPIKFETHTIENVKASELELAKLVYEKNAKTTLLKAGSFSPILPTPYFYERQKGEFVVSPKLNIITPPKFIAEVTGFVKDFNTLAGFTPTINGSLKTNIIVINYIKNLKDEAYQLKVNPDKIQINATTNAGVFYALQSLKLLLPNRVWAGDRSKITIKSFQINDEPRFKHRAFMMDIARNFQSAEQIKKVIEVIALYKLNVLHLHFSDDEGWRLEIPGLPELTEVGGHRGHTVTEFNQIVPSYGSGPYRNNKTGSGYLKRRDFVALLKFAKSRHVKIIPEIETPGHARAAIKSMDSRYQKFIRLNNRQEAERYLLCDLNDQSRYRSIQGFNDNVINVAMPSAYTFLQKVSDELISMYKDAGAELSTIHFGGDEVPVGVWEKSPAVAALIQSGTVKKPEGLWSYYFYKINKMLKQRGLYLSGWEEIGLQKVKGKMVLNPLFSTENFHADVWNNLSGNEDLAYRLANAGYKVVLTNVTNMYLDLSYNKSYFEPGQYWGGYVDVDKPFAFIPYNYYKSPIEDAEGKPLRAGYGDNKVQLTEKGKENIVGIQAPLWSEIIFSENTFEYLLFPKLFGVIERAWAKNPGWATEPGSAKSKQMYDAAYNSFVNAVGQTELNRLDYFLSGFNYRIPTPGIKIENGKVYANSQYPNLAIRYTTDGTEPTLYSPKYSHPLPAGQRLTFRIFNQNGRGGRSIDMGE
ncbi:family 20 glycosylhydrolase [Pedobacter sp. BS3]|uniref:family 20 glycosylhydrolase n=1 Tax=Pedobacter sp. BS3 TaxID=2567937 RepID=UPI001658FB31|nr:family 20 glycosylhydrolase [Pedobacter sp. BS3]